ncbi:MAG: CRISPR-associated protein Csx15 [Chloroflexales bacterium]
MILLNYAHPLTDAQRAELVALVGEAPDVRVVTTQIDRGAPLAQTAAALADAAGLSPVEWQTTPLLLNPPGLAPLALALLAELHGRCGYFLPALNMRPVAGAMPPRYEVAEVLNLQAIREVARTRRS